MNFICLFRGHKVKPKIVEHGRTRLYECGRCGRRLWKGWRVSDQGRSGSDRIFSWFPKFLIKWKAARDNRRLPSKNDLAPSPSSFTK
jgi:hypothetical protein